MWTPSSPASRSVALIDEMAHTNVPGSRNAKRYQDIEDLLSVGIHVITTMNVQHLESLYDTIEKSIQVKVRERLPDSVLAEADQIVNIDLATEDLQQRLREGKIYPQSRIETALGNFFITNNLEQLRELTLRELASQIDYRRREPLEEEATIAPDQIMACLSSNGPNSEMLLRYASRLAGKLNRNWYAVYVQTPREDPTAIDSSVQRVLCRHPHAGKAARGHGLHLQGRGCCRYHPSLCPRVPRRPYCYRQPAASVALAEDSWQQDHCAAPDGSRARHHDRGV